VDEGMLNSVRLKRNCTFKKVFIFRTAKQSTMGARKWIQIQTKNINIDTVHTPGENPC
jgi:hypothetical protein